MPIISIIYGFVNCFYILIFLYLHKPLIRIILFYFDNIYLYITVANGDKNPNIIVVTQKTR